jgi:hypothetical protein
VSQIPAFSKDTLNTHRVIPAKAGIHAEDHPHTPAPAAPSQHGFRPAPE